MILWRRKTYRLIMGSLFPLVYYFGGKIWAISLTSFFLAGMLFFELERRLHPGLYRWVVKHLGGLFKEKTGHLTGTTSFLLSTFLIIIFLEKSIAIASLSFLVLGDGTSAIIGVKYGTIKLFKGKSLEGSLGFIAINLVFSLLLLSSTRLSLHPYVAIVGLFFGALIEALPIPIDDNLSVGLGMGLIMHLSESFM